MQVGQEVYFYCEHVRVLFKSKITKVGRKYIYILTDRGGREYQFNKDTLTEVNNWGSESQLYLSKQDYEDDRELSQNILDIRLFFRDYHRPKLTLDQSWRILKIIGEEAKE